MKQTIFIAATLLVMAGCKNEVAKEAPKRGGGYTEVETENVKLAKALNDASVRFDTAAMRTFYSSGSDTIHNNLEDMTLDQNLLMIADLQKQGYTMNIEKYSAIWETINHKPNDKGVSNFVLSYNTLNVSKSGMTRKILFHQVFGMKDGKIVEEWDVYDTKPLNLPWDEVFFAEPDVDKILKSKRAHKGEAKDY